MRKWSLKRGSGVELAKDFEEEDEYDEDDFEEEDEYDEDDFEDDDQIV